MIFLFYLVVIEDIFIPFDHSPQNFEARSLLYLVILVHKGEFSLIARLPRSGGKSGK